jgi:hypothetical protein
MTCVEFKSAVVGIAREEPANRDGRQDALMHAKSCTRCGRRLAAEKLLSAALKTAAEEDAARGAPPVVEKILVAVFRDRQAGSQHRRRAWMARAAVGAAAAVLVIMGFWASHRPEPPRDLRVKSAPASPAPLKVIAPVYREARKPPAPVRVARGKPRLRPKAARALENREVMTDFLPVIYDPEPIEHGRLVRVRLPRAALTTFGLPVNEQLAEEPIKADVLLGEDGLARAVRFVK